MKFLNLNEFACIGVAHTKKAHKHITVWGKWFLNMNSSYDEVFHQSILGRNICIKTRTQWLNGSFDSITFLIIIIINTYHEIVCTTNVSMHKIAMITKRTFTTRQIHAQKKQQTVSCHVSLQRCSGKATPKKL